MFEEHHISLEHPSTTPTPELRIRWVEKLIQEGELRLINSSEFRTIRTVWRGGHGLIEFCRWEKENRDVVLKHMAEIEGDESATHKNLVHELKVYREITGERGIEIKGFNNIIRFYGVSYFEEEKIYKLVLERAKCDLRRYMKDSGEKMDWSMKIEFVKQISDGLYFLHSKDILHRDLHTENILVQQFESGKVRLLIADYGFSKVISRGSLSVSQNQFGKVAFVDPFILSGRNNRHDKSSDIYSFGVAMWEISSNGREPFEDQNRIALLARIAKMEGYRENPIPGTPKSYVSLYQKCWQDERSNRPTMEQIEDYLKDMDLYDIWIDEPSASTEMEAGPESDPVSRASTPLDENDEGKEKFLKWLLRTPSDDLLLQRFISEFKSLNIK